MKDVMQVFALYDLVGGTTLSVNTSRNSATYIRENVPFLIKNYPLKDLELYRIGHVDMSTMEITSIPKEKVSWSDYKYPENKSEALAPLGSDVIEAVSAFEKKVEDIKNK